MMEPTVKYMLIGAGIVVGAVLLMRLPIGPAARVRSSGIIRVT